jgi:hypothetical protein
MKLKSKTYTDKKGNQQTQYTIKKANEFGEGLVVDTPYKIVLAFDVQVRRTPWHDPVKKVDKVIVSVNAVGRIEPSFENVVYNSYDNASFSLPAQLEEEFKDAKKGDTIFFALKSFEAVEQDGKKVRRSTWIGSVNKELDFRDAKREQRMQPAPATPPMAKMEMPKPINRSVNNVGHPADIQKVISFCTASPDDFKNAFYVPANTKPQAFVDWVRTLAEVTTKLDDGQLVAIYYEIVDMVK